MTEHTVRSFSQDLEELSVDLARMGGLAEDMLSDAIQAISTRDSALADTVAAAPVHLAPPRFSSTNRWLRGRILDRLRAARDGEWVVLDGAIGTHDLGRVRAAAAAMASDGILELGTALGPDTALRARLPLT